MNEVGYVLLGAALGIAFQIWVLVYSFRCLRAVIDRFNDQRWEDDTLQGSVLDVNRRLWGAGMYTAEEERASKRGCWTFDLPPEERTNRKESLREQDNQYRQRFLAMARKLDERRAAGRS